MNDEALIALTRIERAVDSYCCRDDSDVGAILNDVHRFAREGIAAFAKDLPPDRHSGKDEEAKR